MISSEVQRTLVKSPPELWAEISDPDALARHLGEFGEIRITRVEPEQRVEWQAGDTAGSVVIKPSGWGTKVKLTVTRELNPSDHDASGTDGSAGETDDSAEESGHPAGGSDDSAEETEHSASGSDDSAEETEHYASEADYDAGEAGRPAGETDPADPAGAHAGDDTAGRGGEAMPAGTDDGQDAPLPAESGGLDEPTQATAPAIDEHENEDEPDRSKAARRGFFARLFSRRRASRAATRAPHDERPDDPAADVPSDELDMPAHEPYNALAVWTTSDEHEHSSDLEAPPEHGRRALTLDDLIDGDAGLAHAAVDVDGLGGAAADVEHASAPGDASAGEPVDDEQTLAQARLKAAEEAGAEEVTAVLTGVLDRLGAAHHRPFSRA